MSEEDPFEDLPDDGEGDQAVDDLFTEVEVADVDDEAVWDELTAGEGRGASANGDGAADPDADAVAADDGEGTVVPKASYCQQCEHFSPPPGVSCDNPGTDILELVDVEHFRVRDCPVAARRQSATRDLGDDA